MSPSVLKKDIHAVIDRIRDEQALKIFRQLLIAQAEIDEANFNGSEYELSEEKWAEIEKQHSDYLNGRIKFFTMEEVNHKLDEIKKSFRKKTRVIRAAKQELEKSYEWYG